MEGEGEVSMNQVKLMRAVLSTSCGSLSSDYAGLRVGYYADG